MAPQWWSLFWLQLHNKMKYFFAIALLLFLNSCSSLTSNNNTSTQTPLWANAVDAEIKALGSYNWIIIADASFPALSTKGSHILVTPTNISGALDYTIQSIESLSHVRPRIYATRESLELSEANAPGIKSHTKAIQKAIAGRETINLSERTIKRLVLEAGKKYRILIIKTESTLPYSSIYLELESGYWDSEAETALRKGMKKQS